MTTFAIDTDNTITAYLAGETIPEGQARFSTEKELAKLAANWPADRLVQIWNSFAGVAPFDDLKPVKKFTDRKTAVARVWKAIQRLDAAPAAPQAAGVAPKAKRPGKAPKAEDAAPTAREGSKKAIVLEMLRRAEGATLADIQSATGWQPHSVRGFISGALGKKMGLTVESFKTPEGARAYRIAQ
ncbi:MAG TPA: DUF3489 domain-containing protein [Bryobacteraceae bacterium]|nr:DUF3489 domain-containing protein [Bryobacteraceae bacterium]HPU72419.1 DUF3489 domain-containing protein [Bryobacteraceae bacterium]